jgi:hypothetical protein
MKFLGIFLFVFLFAFLIDCGIVKNVGCTVTQTSPTQSLISCADGTSTTVTNGTKGDSGDDGLDGTNGSNGANGSNGIDGTNGVNAVVSSGPIGPMVAGKQYSVCHHDYTYLSNGWLLLSHQRNGTQDQGAGSTGFNVWRADINNFILMSEVGNVTYCTLYFDMTLKKLTYTVNDNTDGQRGITGTINL